MTQKNDITVYLAVKNKNSIKNTSVFTRIKANHKGERRQNFRIENVIDAETFTTPEGPAHLLTKNQYGGFMYFMEDEPTTEQFDKMIATGIPFAIVHVNQTGYYTLCYNRINTQTNTTRIKVGTPT